jgi:Fe-S-cluster containining protein
MKFSFDPGKHRFKCVQCGKCCYPAALSLTEEDQKITSQRPEAAKAIVENPDPPFTHALVCRGRCPFLTDDKLCNIWQDRPAVCASFPLTFTFTPEGEMYVNYISCDGEDAEGGEPVDEAFVRKTIGEVESRNPNFFEVLKKQKTSTHQLFFPFYTQGELTDYDSKQTFKEKLSDMLLTIPEDRYNFRVSCHSFIGVVRETLEDESSRTSRGRTKAILFGDDIERIAERIEGALKARWTSVHDELMTVVDVNERAAMKMGMCEILWEGKVSRVSLDKILETSDLTGTNRSIMASSVFFRRNFSKQALKLLLGHLSQVLIRVDLGGFPMDAELSVMLQTLGEYVNNLETYCYMYADTSAEISESVANQVIRDLDAFFVLGGSYANRVGTILLTRALLLSR